MIYFSWERQKTELCKEGILHALLKGVKLQTARAEKLKEKLPEVVYKYQIFGKPAEQ